MGQGLLIKDPVVVGESEHTKLLITKGDIGKPNPDTQVWDVDDGYTDIKPLQVWLKFLYYIEGVTPPRPWVEPESVTA